MASKGEANAGSATNLKEGEIKTETNDNFSPRINEGREPGLDLTVIQPSTDAVTRKEKAVKASLLFLNKAESIVASYTTMFPEFKHWQDQIKQILDSIERPRVLVGVLGYTGSGKSSLINALIDEEMVVPANAMRASTSMVTEISWNDSDDPEKAFRAEIEFISEKEWKAEMDILLDDLQNATKGEDLSVDTGSEASTAFAKISAVWPGVTLDKLKGMTSEELFHEIEGVSNHLDCNLDISDSKAKSFSQQINSYIDSNNKQASSKGISYWPLVRCVRIYTKAEILRHGLVLVDLPGLGDSNTGRTQVAEKYVKNLTYVWVVADIVRAIDDQVARDLMGKSFRRQLLMDGKYDDKYVTFIMTKTDMINTDEVIESLQLREHDLKEILLREEEILKQIPNWQEALDRKALKVKNINKALKTMMKVYKSSTSARAILRKRKHTEDDMTDLMSENEEQSSADSETPETQILERKHLVKKRAHSVKSVRALEKKLAEMKRTLKLIRNDIKAACTQARNRYTQENLKVDFENGLRDLKQDISHDTTDEHHSGNEDEERNKDSVHHQDFVNQLNIFCVSSKGYQKLAGRFKRDRIPEGFASVNDTFIPGLQEHAAASTLTTRTKIADTFLNDFQILKLSIKSWAKNGSPNSLSSSQKHKLQAMLEQQLGILNKSLGCASETTTFRIREIINTDILPTLNDCIETSTIKARQTCKALTESDTSFQTWKAICRRQGKFNNKRKVNYDWNGVFLEPFLECLANPWDRVFNVQMQHIHDECSRTVVAAINSFSTDIRPLLHDISEASASNSPVEILAKIPYLQRKTTTKISASMNFTQSQAQEIYRLIEPLIQQHMRPAYHSCSLESNTGALARMKEHLLRHIRMNNENMYKEASKLLKKRLNKMIKTLEGLLSKAHIDTSKYLRKEIEDMIMVAVGKDDEAREKMSRVRNTLCNDLILELNTLEMAWVRSASEPAENPMSLNTDRKVEDDSGEDGEGDDFSFDTESSDGSEGVESTSDEVEGS
ncbi:uncharacterized protein EAF01_003799 [Botrytis porri]|uniref:uncharacterized protein n=1 Tax=Botrytis porri TaxID=87229 RepID=UPI00190001EB|nr:uncharacterized protein EAF01_003799 [Botrytis porri]KAF7908044.1 hypothetical protein EAF01_003799 [Botrytis porri]